MHHRALSLARSLGAQSTASDTVAGRSKGARTCAHRSRVGAAWRDSIRTSRTIPCHPARLPLPPASIPRSSYPRAVPHALCVALMAALQTRIFCGQSRPRQPAPVHLRRTGPGPLPTPQIAPLAPVSTFELVEASASRCRCLP